METKRINASACIVNSSRHIYVFGGRSEYDEFYDSIERFNIDLGLWNLLQIKMPEKLCNLFVFHFNNNNEDNFLIFGGLKIKESQNEQSGVTLATKGACESEVDSNVYMFNKQK